MNGEQFCIDISTTDDDIGEGTEQFELYFENLPSEFARDGDPNVLCVNILDNESELSSGGLGKLSKPYLLAAVSSWIFNELDFSPKTGTNQSIAVERFGLCKLSSSFQYLYIVFV